MTVVDLSRVGHLTKRKLVFGLPVELSPEERARHLDYVLPVFVKAFEPSPPQ